MGVKEIKVGLLAISGLVVAYFGFSYLKGNTLFDKGYTFYSVYDDVEGLHVGSKVVLNGFPIGKVRQISFFKNGNKALLAEYVIDDATLKIPSNSIGAIISTDIFGSKAINLLIGDANTLAQTGDTLVSEGSQGMFAMVDDKLKPYEIKLNALLTSVDSLLINVNTTFDTVNAILIDEKKNIGEITDNAVSITQNIENNNAKISHTISNLSDLSDSITQADVKRILDNANLAVINMAEAMEKVNKGNGTLGKMMNDSTLYLNLNQSARDLDILLKDMQEHPKRYVHFSLFGGKDKSEQ